MKITDFVKKDNLCHFVYFRQGNFYFTVYNRNESSFYLFPVPLEDLGDATIKTTEKAIMLMRYIRKALEEKTLVKDQMR